MEVLHVALREVIKTECFKNQDLAEECGWYRKFFYCTECGLEIKHETWDGPKNHMFGNSTILKDNQTPNFCPNCGTRTDG
jgi:rubrerythrin